MAQNPSVEKELDNAQVWDPNPLVVVSKRNRSLYFPKILLQRDITSEDEATWAKELEAAESGKTGKTPLNIRQEAPLYLAAGVNLIGCYSSVFSFKKLEQNQRPVDGKGRPVPPPADKLVLLYPQTPAWRIFEGPGFVSSATQQIDASKVHAAFVRVFKYLKKRDEESAAAEGYVGLFQTPPGFSSAEILQMPLADVFSQKGQDGQAAYGYALSGVKIAKNLGQLGALHDYAFRHASGWNIVEACRTRSIAFGHQDD